MYAEHMRARLRARPGVDARSARALACAGRRCARVWPPRSFVTEATQPVRIVRPPALDSHKDFQIDLGTEQPLHVETGLSRDRLELLAILADHDRFLSRT